MKSENKIQQECLLYFQANCKKDEKFIFIPNEGQQRFISIGLHPGCADVMLLLEGAKVVFVEMKTLTGTQSDKQKKFQNDVEALGFQYYLCRSLESFIEIFNNF
jgi:hypothetical protein